jgi:hypothetical protein
MPALPRHELFRDEVIKRPLKSCLMRHLRVSRSASRLTQSRHMPLTVLYTISISLTRAPLTSTASWQGQLSVWQVYMGTSFNAATFVLVDHTDEEESGQIPALRRLTMKSHRVLHDWPQEPSDSVMVCRIQRTLSSHSRLLRRSRSKMVAGRMLSP